jgi:hypothetical protein
MVDESLAHRATTEGEPMADDDGVRAIARRVTMRHVDAGADPRVVATCVVKLLRSKNPPVYATAPASAVGLTMMRYVVPRVFHTLLRRSMKLPYRPPFASELAQASRD